MYCVNRTNIQNDEMNLSHKVVPSSPFVCIFLLLDLSEASSSSKQSGPQPRIPCVYPANCSSDSIMEQDTIWIGKLFIHGRPEQQMVRESPSLSGLDLFLSGTSVEQ